MVNVYGNRGGNGQYFDCFQELIWQIIEIVQFQNEQKEIKIVNIELIVLYGFEGSVWIFECNFDILFKVNIFIFFFYM